MIWLATLIPPGTKAQDDQKLFPIIQDNKIGYIDKTGKVIIPPEFDKGYLNEGNMKAAEFSDGLALANLKGKFGYIDKTGVFVIKPTYVTAWPFAEGLAPVRVPDGRTAYIDKTGKIVIKALSTMGGDPFSEGLAGVYIGESSKGKWGFIDKSGKMIIEPHIDAAGPFAEGLASVRIGDKYGFIDREGNFPIPLQNKVSYGPPFYQGYALVWNSEGKGDLIDKSGAVICDFRYRSISPFSEGLAVVDVNIQGEAPLGATVDPKHPEGGTRAAGFIDKTCKIVIEPQYEFAGSFSEGLAPVGIGIRPNMKVGYIDKTGAVIIPPSFEMAFPFRDGLALVVTGTSENPRWGYIDATGNYVWRGRLSRREEPGQPPPPPASFPRR
jgi:hypothetical protein